MMLSIGILVFDEVETLAVSGPHEVFSTAARLQARCGAGDRLFRCFLVAQTMRPVHTRGGMKLLPDVVLPPASDIDILIIPGGDVTVPLRDPALLAWLRRAEPSLTASVCDGAFLLAEAGILQGLDVTTDPKTQQELQRRYPHLSVRAGVPWVDCGKVLTAGGIAQGIAMSLHLVARLAGADLARATAKHLQYPSTTPGADLESRATGSRLFLAA